MSISSKPNQPAEAITRDRLIKRSSIKRVFEKSVSDPVNFLMVACFLITGLGELIGRALSWKWYILLTILVAIFALDKFYISKKNEEIIIKAEEPKPLD